MDNAWGIVRCILDLIMSQQDGKYLIVKDPNKPILRLYDIPDNTFESEDESEESEEGEEIYFSYRVSIINLFPKIFISL